MTGLAYAENINPHLLVSHNVLDFEHHSSSADTYAMLSYDADLDWTKAVYREDAGVIAKHPISSHHHTQDTLIANDLDDTKQHIIPVGTGHVFDDCQNEGSDLSRFGQPIGETVFSGLPPLHRGQAGVHMRNGILNARQLAAAGEPDAEKAFFVGDLGQVYKQHLRWTACLPEIQPFYGTTLSLLITHPS
jgi:hypothetical protein